MLSVTISPMHFYIIEVWPPLKMSLLGGPPTSYDIDIWLNIWMLGDKNSLNCLCLMPI